METKLVHIRPIHGSAADRHGVFQTLCGASAWAKNTPWIFVSSLPAWDAGDPVEGVTICPDCRAAVAQATQPAAGTEATT